MTPAAFCRGLVAYQRRRRVPGPTGREAGVVVDRDRPWWRAMQEIAEKVAQKGLDEATFVAALKAKIARGDPGSQEACRVFLRQWENEPMRRFWARQGEDG